MDAANPAPLLGDEHKFAHPRGKNNVNLAQVNCGYALPVSRLRLESPTYDRGLSLDSSLRLADVRAGLYTWRRGVRRSRQLQKGTEIPPGGLAKIYLLP